MLQGISHILNVGLLQWSQQKIHETRSGNRFFGEIRVPIIAKEEYKARDDMNEIQS